ncbi:DUF4123 domain-containing protein (plasmid) [Xanthomonas citri pv. citri]|uniref:DUF4123 domain-containing protein n=1 Tax=Xanthomonas citri TaxID=346 RepID=UPI0019319BB6|nr:DUF4123 domain-containing protein [Xanthomonas citri]QRD62775.1 DUF4123 domain-containing protein [Xanthomonas citri pv. citri]QRD67102.1 DUF4123 domain-containing protein [Xanthomonas citri pv. citri]QRD71645.1 DUF4123 domain-containing protein [Xanthomonas citri pv. citri]
MHRYLIIDCAVRQDAARTLRFYAEGLPHRSLFHGQPEAKHADVGPWLVQVDGSNALHGWVNALEGSGGRTPCVTHLATSDSFEGVFAHLQSLLDMRLADGSTVLLRFWDPRVVKRLKGILTAEQFRSMIAPFVEWRSSQGRYSNAD